MRQTPVFNPVSPSSSKLTQSWRQRTGGGFKFGDDPTATASDSESDGGSNDVPTTALLYKMRCEQSGSPCIAEVLDVLGSSPVLSLTERALTHADVAAVAFALRNDTHVRELHLRACELTRASGGELADLLRFNEHLLVLDLAENELLGDAGVAPIATALRESNTSLQRLLLANCGLTDASAPRIADVLSVNQRSAIECVDLQRNALSDVGATALAAGIRINRRLKTLVLRFNHIGDAGASAIGTALSTGNAPVRELDLGGNRIGGVGMVGLARAFQSLHSELERLNVRQNQCTDDGAVALVRAAASAQLRELYLGLNALSARGVEQIFAFLHSSASAKLCTIDLQSAPVDDAAARAVAAFLSADSHLQELVLAPVDARGEPVGADALDALASSLLQGGKSLLTWHMGDVRADDPRRADALESIRMTIRVNQSRMQASTDAAWDAVEPVADAELQESHGSLDSHDFVELPSKSESEPVREPDAKRDAEPELVREPEPVPEPEPEVESEAPELTLLHLRTTSPPLADVNPRQYRQLPPEPPRQYRQLPPEPAAAPEQVAPPAPAPEPVAAPAAPLQIESASVIATAPVTTGAATEPAIVAATATAAAAAAVPSVDQAMAFYFAQVQEHFGQVEQRLAALDSRLHAVEANCLALTAARQVASRNEAALEERVVERVSRATNDLALRVMRAERFAASRIGEPNEPVASLPALQAQLAETLLRVEALEAALATEQSQSLSALDAMLLRDDTR
jgi:Ran GTPase-activating protein (RanGAP) involved in mRNA processing and transport